MNIAMQVEGVLHGLVGDAPIREGIYLYQALAGMDAKIMLITQHDQDALRTWLRHQRLTSHILLTEIDHLDYAEQSVIRTLGRLRASGRVDLYIDADPFRVADAYRHGYACLPLFVPAYAHPHWHPDRYNPIRPWGELTEEIVRQHEYAAQERDAAA